MDEHPALGAGWHVSSGRIATMTHDYVRHGTTTLFAALNVLEGTVLGRCMQRHRHQEFIRLNAVEASVPAGKVIHAILDNYAAHKHPRVRAWLSRHPRWVFHFTPTSASWLNGRRGLLLGAAPTAAQARRLHSAATSGRYRFALSGRAGRAQGTSETMPATCSDLSGGWRLAVWALECRRTPHPRPANRGRPRDGDRP